MGSSEPPVVIAATMVLVTGWLLLRWIYTRLNREKPSLMTTQEKMRRRLETLTKEQQIYSIPNEIEVKDTSQDEIVKLKNDLMSVRAVLEIKTEELTRLRREIDRRNVWREDKETMTYEGFDREMSPLFSRQDDQRTQDLEINQVDESEISDNNSEMSVTSESNQDSTPDSSDLEEMKP